MVQITEAIYTQGVLRPVSDLNLHDQQRVKVTVESVETEPVHDRAMAMRELRDKLLNSGLHYGHNLPRRDELYDRF